MHASASDEATRSRTRTTYEDSGHAPGRRLRLLDRLSDPAQVYAHQLALPLHHPSRDETFSTLLVSIRVTIVPGTLFIGNTLIRSIASMRISASLPGVSVPILASR